MQFAVAQNLPDYLRRVTEIAPALIYVYNQAQHQNEFSNRSIGETLGYGPDEIRQMGDKLMLDLLHPDDAATVFAHFEAIKGLDDDASLSVEYRMLHRDGHWVWLLSRDCVFKRDARGAVTHHIGAAVDITAQKAAETAAKVATMREVAINSELREFAYSLSHDLKAPSNTLHLVLNELQESLGDHLRPDDLQLLAMAQKTVSGMQTLIDELLGYTRVIGDRPEFSAVDLANVVDGLISKHAGEIEGKSARVTVDDLPKVMGNRTQLELLISNLLANALKFSQPGAVPEVHIGAQISKAWDRVVVSVRDNGIGIPPEKAEEIFKIFRRLHAPSIYDGTGVGLAICKRVAMNHGTDITLHSSPGHGATFSFELALA